MKSLLFIAAILLNICSYAQDLITTTKGEDIQAKVIEVGLNEIKYRKFDNLNGPLITLAKSDIVIIRYENGSKDIFDKSASSKPNVDLTREGELDV